MEILRKKKKDSRKGDDRKRVVKVQGCAGGKTRKSSREGVEFGFVVGVDGI